MVDYSDIRHTSPSITFFFAHLGAFLGSLSGLCPRVRGFVLGDIGLELALVSLYPLLHQSLDWFRSVREVLRREGWVDRVIWKWDCCLTLARLGLTQTPLLLYLRLPTLLFHPHPDHFTPQREVFPKRENPW